MQKISDNQYAISNEKFFKEDLSNVDLMLVSADISINKVGLSVVRDKGEMKSIRNGMDKISKKIHLDTNNYAVWGRIHLIKLNDDISEKAKEENLNPTDEQLKWLFENNMQLNKNYGEILEGVAVDSYCNFVIKNRVGETTTILDKDFDDLTKQQRGYDLQKHF